MLDFITSVRIDLFASVACVIENLSGTVMVFVFMLVASPFPIPPLLDVLGHCMIILEVKVWLFIRANSAVAE